MRLLAACRASANLSCQACAVVVPFPAGGIVDILTRAITEKMASSWGQPIIVETKPGAGALIGTEAVATSAPDGYTFLVASITGAVGPLLNPQFKYDLRKDFTAVGMFATAPNIAVVPTTLGVNSMARVGRIGTQKSWQAELCALRCWLYQSFACGVFKGIAQALYCSHFVPWSTAGSDRCAGWSNSTIGRSASTTGTTCEVRETQRHRCDIQQTA